MPSTSVCKFIVEPWGKSSALNCLHHLTYKVKTNLVVIQWKVKQIAVFMKFNSDSLKQRDKKNLETFSVFLLKQTL